MNADDARTARKKRQQMFRKRKESLFGKAEELSEFTQVDVCLIVRHPQQGRFFTFAHINERFWPSGIVEALQPLISECERPSSEDTEEIPIALKGPGTASIELEQGEENVEQPNRSRLPSFLVGVVVGMAVMSVVQVCAASS